MAGVPQIPKELLGHSKRLAFSIRTRNRKATGRLSAENWRPQLLSLHWSQPQGPPGLCEQTSSLVYQAVLVRVQLRGRLKEQQLVVPVIPGEQVSSIEDQPNCSAESSPYVP